MGRASPTEVVLTVYLASLECKPIAEGDLINMVKGKFGCDEDIVKKAVDVLVNAKRTWVREGALLRPKSLRELDYGTNLGSFPVKIKKRHPVLSYAYFGLALVIAICAVLQYFTPIFLFLPLIILSSGFLLALALWERFYLGRESTSR